MDKEDHPATARLVALLLAIFNIRCTGDKEPFPFLIITWPTVTQLRPCRYCWCARGALRRGRGRGTRRLELRQAFSIDTSSMLALEVCDSTYFSPPTGDAMDWVGRINTLVQLAFSVRKGKHMTLIIFVTLLPAALHVRCRGLFQQLPFLIARPLVAQLRPCRNCGRARWCRCR